MTQDPVESLFRCSQRDWGVFHQRSGHFFGASVEIFFAGQLVEQANALHLFCVHELRQKNQLFGPGHADQPSEPGKVPSGKGISQGSRDRKPESRRGRTNSQVARRGDPRSTASASTVDGGNRRHGDVFQRIKHPIHRGLVGERLFVGAEVAELRDVRSGYKCLAASASQDHHPHRLIVVDLRAQLLEPRVHCESHRVARLGPIESQPGHAIPDFEESFLWIGHCDCRMTPACSSPRISCGEYPTSSSTCAECSPSSGPARNVWTGVSDSRIGEPICLTRPNLAWGASLKKSRARRCGSSKTWSYF